MRSTLKISTCLIFLIVYSIPPAAAQLFQNLDFRQTCDSTKTGFCHWDLSWGGEKAVSKQITNGKNFLAITGQTENAVGFVEQTVNYPQTDGLSILTLAAMIKSDTIMGKGAGLNIGLYDEAGRLIATKDMGGYYSLSWIQGSTGWTSYSLSIVCPPETSTIRIGAILYGKGTAGFSDYQVALIPVKNRKANELATAYINSTCDLIKTHSLIRDSLNMDQLKATALEIAGEAKTQQDCHLAVHYLLESLRPHGDDHSFFMSKAEYENWENEGSQVVKITYSTFKVIDNIGYIIVPPFHGGNQDQVLSFADSLQASINHLYHSGIKGWIIDLRQNTGGNMAPMVAGLGPLFSTEKLGALVDVNGKANAWYYKDGAYYWDDEEAWSVSTPIILEKKLPIAVLVGSQTGSSGEAVTVSFVGNEKTKLFGQPTWGLTTGNGEFKLPDGSYIFLASTIYADRHGNQFEGSIEPDEVVEENAPGEKDITIEKAIEWLRSFND